VDDGNPTGLPQVAEELSSGGVVQKRYVYGLARIGQTQVATAATSFYGYDGHGDVRYLMDVTGAVTDTYDYDAFGNVVGSTGTTANVYRYQGEAFDTETGLYYLRARYYDPVPGRFLSVDPMADQGQHPYTYAGADPVNGHDRTGTQEIIEYDLLKAYAMPPVEEFEGMEEDIKCIWGMTASFLENPGIAMGRVAGCGAAFAQRFGGTGYGDPNGPPPKPLCNCTYHIREHRLECANHQRWGQALFETANARAGNNNNPDYPKRTCVNNPACEDIEDVGPLPEGDYQMGADVVVRGTVRIPLTFLGGQSYGRGGFQIHQDWPTVPNRTVGTQFTPASEGCIATGDYAQLRGYFAGQECKRGVVTVLQ
jgi:RHS repeat-associated protein